MKKLITAALVALAMVTAAHADHHGKKKQEVKAPAFDKAVAQQMIENSIQRFKLVEGVTLDDAIEGMKSRATALNFKLVAELPLSKDVEAKTGKAGRTMHILAFCDSLIAKEMVEYNMIFAGFLPCRIAAIEDAEGNGWLVTMNMDMMLHAVELTPELTKLAKKVRDDIYSIVEAGVNGDF